jgi:hypothetical protein
MKDWFLEKTKSWVAGLGGALSVALIKYIETSAGIDIDDTMEIAVSAAVTGFILQQLVYWFPNKPMAK